MFHCDSFRCISFYSYIKPQLKDDHGRTQNVVYRSIPTSNRNDSWSLRVRLKVVYRSIPTSNRNERSGRSQIRKLYIVLFLHQTATQHY